MDLWKKFRSAEFDQIMRQDDEMFVNFLNKLRVGKIDQNLENVIKSKFIDKDDPGSPGFAYFCRKHPS